MNFASNQLIELVRMKQTYTPNNGDENVFRNNVKSHDLKTSHSQIFFPLFFSVVVIGLEQCWHIVS